MQGTVPSSVPHGRYVPVTRRAGTHNSNGYKPQSATNIIMQVAAGCIPRRIVFRETSGVPCADIFRSKFRALGGIVS